MKRALLANSGGTPKIRFIFPGEKGYSACWRRDKSPVEILELTKLLRAIRKIVSYIGSNVGEVFWEGMEFDSGISLDPSPILGKYPVPAAKVDIIVGLAVLEAYQKTEWSGHLKELASKRINLSPGELSKFALFLDTAEKVYADILAHQSVLGLYSKKARKWQIEKRAKVLRDHPNVSYLLDTWWKIAGEGEYSEENLNELVDLIVGSRTLTKIYKEPLALLLSLVGPLKQECSATSGVTERCECRLRLYIPTWQALKELIKTWPEERADLVTDSSQTEEKNENDEEPLEELFKKATPGKIVGRKRRDFTVQIKSLVRNSEEVVPVEHSDIAMPPHDMVDKVLLQRLRLLFRSVAQRNITYNRGLTSGKIDRRRLYRAHTTGTIFTLKKDSFDLANDFVILVDCTESMSISWIQMETLYQTLFTALRTYASGAKIFGYNEEIKDICRITELYQNGKFVRVFPQGKTASGEAIIATALTMKTKAKRPFLIHLTDGMCNWGCGVDEAIRVCKERKINLLTLVFGCEPQNRPAISAQYGKFVQFVDDLTKFPRQLVSLLRATKWL